MAITSRFVELALTLACSALACAGAARAADEKKAGGERAAMPLAQGGVLLTQNDGGAEVTLRHGDALVVSLEFKSGTGFGWKVKDDCKKHLRLKEHVVLRSAKALPGSPNYATYLYEAKSIGKCDLVYQVTAPPGVLGKTLTYHLTVLPKVTKGAKE